MLSLKIDDHVSDDLDKFSEETEESILDVMDDVTRKVAADAQANAPVDTGAGKASITTDVGYTRYKKPYGAIRCGGGDEYYMWFHEFGTSTIPAKAFMRTAADNNRNYITDAIRGALKRVKWQ